MGKLSKKRIVAVDFFCGVGGLTRGLLDAGIDVVLGIDSDATAKEAYENNNGVRFLCRDIAKMTGKDLRREIGIASGQTRRNSVLLFSGCAPCQPFSKIKKEKGQDPEARLLLKFGQMIEEYLPDVVFSENVPQIRKHKVFKSFLGILNRNHYKCQFKLVNACDFGVPQKRIRLVLIGTRIGEACFPKPILERVTVRSVISHFPPIAAGERHASIPNHASAKLTDRNLVRVKATSPNGGDCRKWPRNILLECQKRNRRKGYYDVYGRMGWDEVSPTLTTRCISLSNGRYGHPEQNRAISVREAAAIQTFPDNYIFSEFINIASKHIGNAVPPKLAKCFGKRIVEMVNEKRA